MNACVQEFLGKHPKANVRLQYHHPDTVVQLVETDQVDFGLVSYPKASKTIKVDMWREEPVFLICAPGSELAERDSVWLDELDGRRMVSFDMRLQIRREIDFVLSSAGADVQVVMEFDNIETIKRAIEIDAGFGLLPIDTVTREVETGSLVALPIEGTPLARPLGIVTRQGKELGKTARRFIQLLHEKADGSEAEAAESEIKPVAASFASSESADAQSDLENGVSARS